MRPSRFLSTITTSSALKPDQSSQQTDPSQDIHFPSAPNVFSFNPSTSTSIEAHADSVGTASAMIDEKTPLLAGQQADHPNSVSDRQQRHAWPKRIASGFIGAFRVIISTILAPGYYLIACFYDEHGNFSAAMPIHHIGRALSPKKRRRKKTPGVIAATASAVGEKTQYNSQPLGGHDAGSEEALDERRDRSATQDDDSPARHTRSQSSSSTASDESEMTRRPKRSIRIKALSEETLRKRNRHRIDAAESSSSSTQPPLTVDTIKSPISLTALRKDTRWPRAPAPPRPLIPKRQPSFSNMPISWSPAPRKTLIIDLDETLIHSMAKGGRMSTGHMVEVKLQTPVGIGGSVIGPQVPILYYVHKRPYCDEFLRKVSRWYNLIVFTASVQEYADPVIDWLELERKYFSARYYRQHCTYRNGAYIKDLSHVEPDLSRVMILDNSPMSYIFHEDNAIPIEGWISDPTDNDLQHLVPMLEGLQYATDVRALLALRLGESSHPT